MGEGDHSYQFGTRMQEIEGVQECYIKFVAVCKSEFIEPSNFLLVGVHIPPIGAAQQGDKFLPQIVEIQARQPICAVDVAEGHNRCELVIMG